MARQIRETLQRLPSVTDVSLSSNIPLSESSAIFFQAEGQPPVDARGLEFQDPM
jgi:hypothetical protein